MITLILHLGVITWINPTFWGYGKANFYILIHATDNHIFLFDQKTAYIPESSSNDHHEVNIPNLRITVVDRKQHKKLYTELIGDYYFPVFYGPNVLLINKDTYNTNISKHEIEELAYFNPKNKKKQTIAELKKTVKIDGKTAKIHEIYLENEIYFIRCSKGDVYRLNPENLEFQWNDKNLNLIPKQAEIFKLRNTKNSVEKQELFIGNESTNHKFLHGKIANEHIFKDKLYILIHSQNDLEKTNPLITLIDGSGKKYW